MEMKMKNMNHSMTEPKEILIMMAIMFVAGLLSSMNIWVDKLSDMRFHLNDIYMSLLMCGWSLVFMGIYYMHMKILFIGIIFTGLIIYCIRTQLFITEEQYIKGMIPHHSMAVLMSNQLLKKVSNGVSNEGISITNYIKVLSNNIINSQNNEIDIMKGVMKTVYGE